MAVYYPFINHQLFPNVNLGALLENTLTTKDEEMKYMQSIINTVNTPR